MCDFTLPSEPPPKKSRSEEVSQDDDIFATRVFVDSADLASIKARLDAFDAMRETVIKKSRDVQKLSKQAIFSLHGGKTSDAMNKLMQASDVAKEVLPLIVEQPSLRSGSYSNSLEEWAEGQLLFHWQDDKTIPGRAALGVHIGQVS